MKNIECGKKCFISPNESQTAFIVYSNHLVGVERRIVGGEAADPGQFPWMVSDGKHIHIQSNQFSPIYFCFRYI